MIKKILFFIFFPLICFANIQIGILGDSISSVNFFVKEKDSYTYLLENEMNQEGYDIKVINFSVGGMPCAGGIDTIQYLYRHCHPDFVIICLGMNDYLSGYPLYASEDALKKVIEKCLEMGSIPMLGIMDMSCWEGLQGKEYTKKFNSMFIKLVTVYQIPSFNYIDTQILTNSLYNSGDKIHPNAKGQRKIYEEIRSVLISQIQDKKL